MEDFERGIQSTQKIAISNTKKELIMKKNTGLIVTLIFGFISFIFVIADYLALHDIYKESGKYDVSGEWTVVSLSLLPIIIFHVLFAVYVVVPFFNAKKKSGNFF